MRTNYRAFEALLAGTVDFAGMFPPAKLSFLETLTKAAAYRHTGAVSWMMNRVVLPMAEFSQVTDRLLFDHGADGSPWNFTVLASQGDPWGVVESDLAKLAQFNRSEFESPLRKRALSYEWKAPETPDLVSGWQRTLARTAVEALVPFTVFVEVTPTPTDLDRVGELSRLRQMDGVQFGLKIRTGGATVPPADLVAFSLECAKLHGLKFKATQGLHEAVSHADNFGFINLLAALNLHFSDGLSQAEIQECLTEQKVTAFEFSTGELKWKGHSLTIAGIEEARRLHGGAFGSCSLDEPAESLKKVMGVNS